MAAFLVLILPLDPAEPAFLLWVCILSLAIMSATQDVAVDAYTIELLKPSEMGIATVSGWRLIVAMVLAGGLL
jgi:PAT family beta-lactamase induction signal transducer AmpG